MSLKKLAARASVTTIAILMATSVAAFDVVCCGSGPDDPGGFGGPTDFAPGGGGGGGGDEEPDHNVGMSAGGGNNWIGNAELTGDCADAGGHYVRAGFCYDRDGNFVPL